MESSQHFTAQYLFIDLPDLRKNIAAKVMITNELEAMIYCDFGRESDQRERIIKMLTMRHVCFEYCVGELVNLATPLVDHGYFRPLVQIYECKLR